MQEKFMSAKAEFCNADARVTVSLNGSTTSLSGGVNKRTTQMYQRGVKCSFLIPFDMSRAGSLPFSQPAVLCCAALLHRTAWCIRYSVGSYLGGLESGWVLA